MSFGNQREEKPGFFSSVVEQQQESKLPRPGQASKSAIKSRLPNLQKQQFKPAQPKKREELGDGVPSYLELKVKFGENIEQLGQEHEKLIEKILEEEEQLIFQHNASCKKSIKIVEEEMAILKEVDKPGSDVEAYVEKLDKVLIRKIEMMTELRKQVLDFYKNIKTEEQMASLFHEMQGQGDDDDTSLDQQYKPSQ